ncbi:tetratricopeptide repeat protein [Fibrisoma limi]|uniref:tetratricopeptide repeat protein n=1 Tax=Fibrisoma limi TaxID=663275 RepID=UPI0005869BDA|nr:tetratricopeptide repeat protein [Fibrisoma limi]
MELKDEIYEQIKSLSEKGESYYEDEKYDDAIEKYLQALSLVPDPKEDWEASTWLYAALGDALMSMNKYLDALSAFRSAEKCPDGLGNPYITLMIGECYFELENIELAREYLLKAYALEGEEIFDDEEEKYFQLIINLI